MAGSAHDDSPLVIGLDVGTSSVKAAVFGAGGRRGAVVRRPVPRRSEADGRVTQEPGDLQTAVFAALEAVVRAAERRPDAVAVSAAMHGLAGLDAHGEVVTPLLTWADDRAAPVVADWIAHGTAGFVHARTGVPLHPMAPVAKLAWFAASEPSLAARVARWVDLKALVLSWLIGDAVTESSSASGWGLMDVRRRVWDDDALRLANVDATRLPDIASPTQVRHLTRAASELVGLAVGTPVVLGAADGPSGNLGVGATEPGVAGVSLGTSGAVRVVVDEVPADLTGLFCYVLDERRWVLGGAVSNGGNVVDWLAGTVLLTGTSPGDGLRDGPRVGLDALPRAAGSGSFDAVLDLAQLAPPGSDGLVMVPYLVAERAPLWDPAVPGAYLGLARRHGAAHLARAALEGVGASLGVIADRIDAVAPITAVRATGGTMASPLWREILAAALGRPMTVASVDEGSALGAAALGFSALGVVDDPVAGRRLITGSQGRDDPVPVRAEPAEAARRTRERIAAFSMSLAPLGAAYRVR